MLSQVKSHQQLPLNEKLRDELLKLKKKDQERLSDSIAQNEKSDDLMERLRSSRGNNAARLCSILKQYGWPTTSLVGKDGAEAAFHLLRESVPQLKVDLLRLVIAAAAQGEISQPALASFIDRLRLDAGLKQMFGTQVTPINGFLVLFPIEAEAQVDVRRKQYELPPLADYFRFLQSKYQMPLVKSTGELRNRFSDREKSSIAATTSTGLFEGQAISEDEVLRVDTNLVSVNVSVYSKKLRAHVSTLSQKDFRVSEDNHDETIAFFAATDVPFDLVLLIDLSGSTAGKRKLILKSTQSFIQAARPLDRLAIVTFSDKANVASPLTGNRAQLLASLNGIEAGDGSSCVWDALKFTLDQVVGSKSLDRRRAVVFMTDGVDNALGGSAGGSVISFADLLEAVRHNDALIIPIYLDTEGDRSSRWFARLYENARKTLALLAEESGGLYYKAKKIEDLDGVYGQVIEDLGKVYSLGYRPTNEKRDGTWRAVKIQIPGQPNLIPRARPGYYANGEA
ncbi:MAG: VWA domain-containing protein [Acidobacteriota bacterium]